MQLALVNKLLHVDSAERVNFDFCQVSMTIIVQDAALLVKKRTSIVTNFSKLARALRQRQCPGLHAHANTMGGKIKQCEIYPDMFCELVCGEVLTERAELDNCVVSGPVGQCGPVGHSGPVGHGKQPSYDDVTAEMNFLMSLEAMSVGALDSP